MTAAKPPGVLPVSVVIPAFNRPEMVRRAVASALGQRPLPPAEVIVVDDCSSDDTGAAAASAGATVIRHDHNNGEGAARNTGIGAATQPWIGLLDSDDEWLPHLLDTLWARRGSHVLVAGAAFNRGKGPGAGRYAGPLTEEVLRTPARLLYPENFVPASGVIVRTDALRTAGGYRTALRHGADLDMWLRVLDRGSGLMVPRVVVHYYLHEGQVTRDHVGMATAQLAVLRAYADRPWWSRTRVEGWRAGSAWDDLRRELAAGDRSGVLRHGAFVVARPSRVLGLLGILVRRFRLRRRTRSLAR